MKLKVGDIEMDSHGGISFGGKPATGAKHDENTGRQRHSAEKTSLNERLPDWPRKAYLLAGVLLLAAAFGLRELAAALIEAATILELVPLIPVPGLVLAACVAFWQAAFGRRGHSKQPVDALDTERSEKLAGHLAGRVEPASVEALIEELGWHEEAVVRGLQAGVRRDLIVEDLDLDSGHWTYAAAPARQERTSRGALPVEERAKRLTSDN